MTRLAVVGMVVGVSLQCTKPNPLSCADGMCSDPSYPFCDSTAQFQENVFTCIAVECTPDAFVACRSDEALTCNALGNDYDVTQCPLGCSQAANGCVACASNSDCKSPTPKCSSGGSCVQCLLNVDCTSSAAAICDPTTNMCRGCQADDECPSRVCDAATGSCLDETQVIYVSSNSHTQNCIPLDPCPLKFANGAVNPTRFTIKMEAGTYVNSGSAVDFSTEPVTIHATGATFSGQSLSTSGGSGDLTIIGGTFSGSAGVTCNQAAVHLTSASVSGGAISGTLCSLTASHSQFTASSTIGGQGCAVAVDHSLFDMSTTGTSMGGTVNVQNSLFNGGGVSFFNAGNSVISFSTFFNSAVTCTDTVHNPPQVSISNDIHFGTGSGDVVMGCPTRYSILQPQAVLVGTDHVVNVDPMFQNAGQGDFHLLLHSPAIDAADPNVSITNDYEGTTRPQGSASDMGAYEYKP